MNAMLVPLACAQVLSEQWVKAHDGGDAAGAKAVQVRVPHKLPVYASLQQLHHCTAKATSLQQQRQTLVAVTRCDTWQSWRVSCTALGCCFPLRPGHPRPNTLVKRLVRLLILCLNRDVEAGSPLCCCCQALSCVSDTLIPPIHPSGKAERVHGGHRECAERGEAVSGGGCMAGGRGHGDQHHGLLHEGVDGCGRVCTRDRVSCPSLHGSWHTWMWALVCCSHVCEIGNIYTN